jgi:site-specific DNA-methyltransferase (adenine-specific)
VTGRALVLRGDARRLPLPDASVDAIVCDPPYGLGFMGKEWDSGKSFVERKAARSNTFDHVGGNHNPVDNADAARTRRVEAAKFGRWCETWAAEALRVLKPGGWLVAFGGTRTWHRLACAVEDAGFEIRDNIGHGCCMAWVQGQGFPKGENALKPAWEPIILARRPLAGTVAGNVLAYGTGALNIDGCRIGAGLDYHELRVTQGGKDGGGFDVGSSNGTRHTTFRPAAGRWPTNVVLSHVPLLDDDGFPVGDACESGCVPGCPVAELDAQSGDRPSTGTPTRPARPGIGTTGGYGGALGLNTQGPLYSDSGGASRFFPTFRYQAKADDWERPTIGGVAHPTVKPLDLIRWLCRLITPPGGLILDQFAGSGTTVEAALLEGFHVIGVEQDAGYLPHITYRVDRARRRMQPGVARLGRTRPTPPTTGQDDLLSLLTEGTPPS